MLAYLARVGEASIAQLARRFAMDEATLVAELELAACCGLPPYTPDQLLELIVDGSRVVARGLEALRRPPRLTPDEGFAVAAAARALLAVHGAEQDGPLASALAKLEAALGADRLDVELEVPEHLEELRQAAVAGRCVEIDYLGARRGDETTRVVEPYAVVAREGHFYLDAFCRLAGDWRRFRVSRVAAVRPVPDRVPARTPPAEFTGARAFAGGATTRLVKISLPSARRVLLDRLAAGPVSESPDGRAVVPVAVGDAHFLGRLLLMLGPEAAVVEPADLAGAAAEVARLALARYRER